MLCCPAKCEPLSYVTCAQFAVEFNKLYDGRNTDDYPLKNPMLKSHANTVHDQVANKAVFGRIQFPIRYNFLQNQQRGVVTRTFGPYTNPAPYFFLVNPTSGKVLGLNDSSCANGSPIEIQDRIYNGSSDHQYFLLTNDGCLKNKGCGNNNRVLTNEWNLKGVQSCRHGNELVIQDQVPGSNADLQRWTFHNKDQSIVNKKCKFFTPGMFHGFAASILIELHFVYINRRSMEGKTQGLGCQAHRGAEIFSYKSHLIIYHKLWEVLTLLFSHQ